MNTDPKKDEMSIMIKLGSKDKVILNEISSLLPQN